MDNNFNYEYRVEVITENINKEIDFYKNCEYKDYPIVAEYITYLENRLFGNQKVTARSKYNNMTSRYEKMDINEYAKDLYVMTYKKPWRKLKDFHKIMKVKDYVNTLEYPDSISADDIYSNREKIIQEITEGINNKKFIKNKNGIIYDEANMKIESIGCLYFNKKKKIYYIEWE